MNTANRMAIRAAAISALQQAPVRDDPLFAAVRRAEAGSPVLVHTPAGEPAFWLVPFVLEGKVCGLAEVDLTGQLSRLGVLGSTPNDRHSWIDPSFFEHPPASLLAEIGVRYGGSALSAPMLSYDSSPSRWAWQMKLSGKETAGSTIFITPGGWYEREAGDVRDNREG